MMIKSDNTKSDDEILPIVSIGMPVFNDKEFLARALESIFQQSFPHFELIISDDCSTDGSGDICRKFAENNKKIKYIRQSENLGISKNMEFLIKKAKGKYFMWAADDDLWHHEFIERLVGALEKNPEAVVAFCPYYFINENDDKIDAGGNVLSDNSLRNFDFSGASPFSRLFKFCKYWDDGFGYGLFVRDRIKNVRFPVWWWVNKKCPYNNIFPPLHFFLTKGNYINVDAFPMWFNRLKQTSNINHNIPFNDNFFKGFIAFALRKFNLYCECIYAVIRAKPFHFYLPLLIMPFLMKRLLRNLVNGFLVGRKNKFRIFSGI